MSSLEVINYLLKSSVALVLFYLFYRMVLGKQQHYQFNRFYLIGSLLLSSILPILRPFTISQNAEAIIDPTIIIMPEVFIVEQIEATSSTDWWAISLIIYILVAIVLLAKFISQFAALYFYIWKNRTRKRKEHGYYVINTNGDIPTSSFFNYIFWDNSKDLTSEEISHIIRHERVHVFESHSFDTILVSVFTIIFWFNPSIWLLKRSIEDNHEFIADASAFTNLEDYTRLLAKQSLMSNGFLLAESFQSPNALKRIEMLLHKKHSGPFGYVGSALIFGLLLFSMSFKIDNEIENNANLATNINTLSNLSGQVFSIVDKSAQPKGGMEAFYEYVNENLYYPKEAVKNNIEGTVFIEFIVDNNGEIIDPKILKGIDKYCDLAVLELIKNTEKWNPAAHQGTVVKQKIVLPISFKLS